MVVMIPQCFAQDNITTDDSYDSITQSQEVQDVLTAPVNEHDLRGADYYFNSSSDTDGDGSSGNPYNTMEPSRLRQSSTIHLANGEYNLSENRVVNGINLIGEDQEKTILRYSGNEGTGILMVTDGKTFIAENVTLVNFNVEVAGGTFYARNVILKDAVGIPTYSEATDLVNSATNSFGGAIIAYISESVSPTVTLVNCTLFNNTAEYGGAIYVYGGNLNIKKSRFIDNFAYNYGGAIAALYSSVISIEDSIFINEYSINDAGGAIYLLKSELRASLLQVYNASSTFGSAITSLNSKITLNHCTMENNTSTYEGGAIYAMYNSLTCIESTFKNNRARNGGAIYGDDLKLFELENNYFISNEASEYAGAVYSMLNTDEKIFYNAYQGNHAKLENNFYESNFTFVISDEDNCTLYYSTYDYQGFIPTSYDLRDFQMVSPVKDQQSGGNCWAFATIASLESAILKASGELLDLSEENMKNMMQLYSNYGWNRVETNGGGNDNMAIGYLVNWLGPVNEFDDYYDDYSMLSPLLNPVTHVQNIVYLKRDSYTDNDAIKEAIMKYGAVSTGIFFSSYYFNDLTNAYFFPAQFYANHGVAIVGWDDDYSRDNFLTTPAGDGAWIVKNSWDSTWGENGYFYVSYYDKVLAEVGISDMTYAFVFNDTAKYDKNYQYDYIGKTDYFVTGKNAIWVENIFNATGYDMLAGVSTYFRKTTDWDLFIYVNDELRLTKSGTCNPGYTTINLGDYIPLQPNDTFKIRFKLNNKNGAEFAISEGQYANKQLNTSGVSFFSKDGIEWIDLYDYSFTTPLNEGHEYLSQVAAIKAFTISYELQYMISLNVENAFNKATIDALVYDQFNNLVKSGNLTFNIGGIEYNASIENGHANLSHTFENKGSFDIDAYYKNAVSNSNVNVDIIDADIGVEILKDKNNVLINFASPFAINSTLNVTINGENMLINLKGGKASLNLIDLVYGEYNLTGNLIDDYYGSLINSDFEIIINRTKIIAEDLAVFSNGEVTYSILLKDIYDNPIVNRQVYFIIGQRQYIGITNWDGRATVTTNSMDFGEYPIYINFYGDENFFDISANHNLKVSSSIIGSTIDGNNYEAVLLNKNGVPLTGTLVNMNVGGVAYSGITNAFGLLSIKLNNIVSNKNYLVSIVNPATGETLRSNVKVKTITENKDLVMYYQDGSVYKVRVNVGGAYKSGEIVKFKIGNKVFYGETNKKGYVTLKITLKPKKYVVTASYNGVKVSNKITVKNILTAKNISKKKAKKIKFTATLKKGKKALAKKKVTFKFNGKTYVSKTNSKGIASVYLKDLNPGKYKIYTIYNSLKIKNTIKIKK